MSHPYFNIKNRQRWSTAISNSAHPSFEIGDSKGLKLDDEDRIVSMGSCFAQHIANQIQEIGLNYLQNFEVSTQQAHLPRPFSANYGNIYTACQLKQLLESCLAFKDTGTFPYLFEKNLLETGYVDMLRPNAQGCSNFEDQRQALLARQEHLAGLFDLLSSANLIIFTLGLTESWVDINSNLVLPIAPGVVGGAYDETRHQFKNWNFNDVYNDIVESFKMLKGLNSKTRLLLTVSPVPLAATYEENDVFVATTYSKSVLRAVAGELSRKFPDIHYFPSYEIINHPLLKNFSFDSDMRTVSAEGVSAVMFYFRKSFLKSNSDEKQPLTHSIYSQSKSSVDCDEDVLETIISKSINTFPSN